MKTVWPAEAFTELDRSGSIPLYCQISTRLEHAIRDGRIPPGARLENETAIASRLGLSRPTVRRAIQELVNRGLVVRRRGVGTQVVQTRMSRPVKLTSLYDDLTHMGRHPSTRVLSVTRFSGDADAAARLGLNPDSEIVKIRRLRFAEGTPMAILENLLPPEHADIASEDLESRGLYEILRTRGVAVRIANQTFSARRTMHDEHELLDIAKGSPILTVERLTFDHNGRVVEVGNHSYRPDLYSFETTLVAR